MAVYIEAGDNGRHLPIINKTSLSHKLFANDLFANNLWDKSVLNWTQHHYKWSHMKETLEFGTQIHILLNDNKITANTASSFSLMAAIGKIARKTIR